MAKQESLDVKFARLESTLTTKLEYIIEELKDLKDNTSHRLDSVEKDKLSREEFSRFLTEEWTGMKDGVKDREMRIRRLEWGLAIATGVLAAMEFYFNYIH